MNIKPMRKGRCGVDYVLGVGKKNDIREPKLLAGDPQRVKALIAGSDFSNKFTSLALCYERQLTDEEIQREFERFESIVIPGLTPGIDYERIAVVHTEYPKDPVTRKLITGGKPRTSIHWICANTELSSNQRLQPYYYRVDRPRFDAFRNLTNATYGFESPTDKKRKRRVAGLQTHNLPKDKKELLAAVGAAVQAAAVDGRIKSREDIAEFLKATGLKVKAQRKNISIRRPGDEKNVRLHGDLYEEGGVERYREAVAKGLSTVNAVELPGSFDRSPEAIEQYRAKLEGTVAKRWEENREKYPHAFAFRLAAEPERTIEPAVPDEPTGYIKETIQPTTDHDSEISPTLPAAGRPDRGSSSASSARTTPATPERAKRGADQDAERADVTTSNARDSRRGVQDDGRALQPFGGGVQFDESPMPNLELGSGTVANCIAVIREATARCLARLRHGLTSLLAPRAPSQSLRDAAQPTPKVKPDSLQPQAPQIDLTDLGDDFAR